MLCEDCAELFGQDSIFAIVLFAVVYLLKDSQEPKLPLLINLATWDNERSFEDWYTQSIAQTYGLSLVFVRALIQNNAIVPFFDGFDEVKEKYRSSCFQKMTSYFGDQRKRQLIVSSRKKEFSNTNADAPVYTAIEVQGLSLDQIKKALSENAHSQAGDRSLLVALDTDKWLRKAVETPFYLNTASFYLEKAKKI